MKTEVGTDSSAGNMAKVSLTCMTRPSNVMPNNLMLASIVLEPATVTSFGRSNSNVFRTLGRTMLVSWVLSAIPLGCTADVFETWGLKSV